MPINKQTINERKKNNKPPGKIAGFSTRPKMFYILAVLSKYTNRNTPLSCEKIAQKVKTEFGNNVPINRKSVENHINEIFYCQENKVGDAAQYLGFTIERKDGKGVFLDKNTAFTDDEMRLLIDSLVYSKCISYKHSKDLVDKLVKQSNKTFRDANKDDIQLLPELHGDNEELIKAYGTIIEAIKSDKQIDFDFAVYEHGKEKMTWEYKNVSPYELVIVNSRFYMICANNEGKPRHFRVDYMYDVIITERMEKCTDGTDKPKTKRRIPMSQVNGLKEYISKGRFDIEAYLSGRPYMYSGKKVRVKFLIKKDYINQVYDWFGLNNVYDCEYGEDPGMRMVTVNAVEEAMLCWLLQFGRFVEVREPVSLRNKVRDAVIEMCGKYGIEVKEENKDKPVG